VRRELSDRGTDRRGVILRAATELFLRDGYPGTSMEAIAAAAGVSKATLYNHFANKAALFAAIVRLRAEALLRPVAHDLEPVGGLRVRLETFAIRFVELVSEPQSLALYRLVLAEAERFPELASTFWQAGPARALEQLVALFEEGAACGELAVEDAGIAAERFIALLLGPWHVRALLDIERPDPAGLHRWARDAVRCFLTLHGVAR